MRTHHTRPYLIGVAGGSGSGKTTIVSALMKELGDDLIKVAHIPHDNYYRDQSHIPMEQRVQTNYDHPLSLETDLLVTHLQHLLAGTAVDIPTYDFAHHTRSANTVHLAPCAVIIVEGILLFESPQLRDVLDLKIFVDTDADLRLARRLQRDVAERGRTYPFSLEQYLHFTRPMHLEFVEPSRRYADLIIPEGVNIPAIDVLVSKVLHELRGKE